MVDFRKWFPALAITAVVIGGASMASAQTAPPLTCTANAGAPPQVRAEGITELVGDFVIICQGGNPTPAGQTVPQVNITVQLNTNVTSRLVADPLSEALILIDDPAPGQQVACVPVTSSANPTSCPQLGNGTGLNFRGSGIPNVYQGRNAGGQGNALVWLGVPIDPPGSAGQRTLRITNVRANASQLGTSSTLVPTQIVMYLGITPFQALPVNNPQQVVGYVQPGLTFGLRNGANSASSSGVTFLQCVNNNTDIAAANTANLNVVNGSSNGLSFVARFTEGFASSFKRRNVATFASADTNPAVLPQPNPGGTDTGSIGGQYFTETGFYNPSMQNASSNGLANAGLADHGTRLMLRFAGIPTGAQIFVGIYDVTGTTPSTGSTAHLRLVSTDANGAGGFSATASTSPGSATAGFGGALAPVTLTAGAGVAVYEVVSSNPLVFENFDVPIAVAYTANTTNNLPALGTGTVTGSFAPLSTITTQSATAPIPRFADNPSNKTALTINACSTNLLFPFVTNQAGFDTGIAIANTSLDPFKTPTQQGACVINYYGNTTGGGAAPAAATSPVVKAGDELVFLVSTGGSGVAATPGFQGYIIAQCAFQYGHGFAFISDLGSQKLAEGYLALVMDSAAPTLPRSKTSSEPLAH